MLVDMMLTSNSKLVQFASIELYVDAAQMAVSGYYLSLTACINEQT
jgi:hypothetical protein